MHFIIRLSQAHGIVFLIILIIKVRKYLTSKFKKILAALHEKKTIGFIN